MISVCMATYNGEKFIQKQLTSILCQLSDDDEVIISDDGSKDNTLYLVSQINDKRIKVVQNKNKRDYSGNKLSSYYYASANFNNALIAANGDFIFLSDQDDIWPSNKVEMFLHYLRDYDIVCSNFSIIDEHDNLVQSKFLEKDYNKCSFIKYLNELPFRGCCLAFNRKVLLNSQPFPKSLFLHDCWIGLNAVISGYRYHYIDIPLLLYRRHSLNVSSIKSPNTLFFKIQYRLILLYQLFALRIKRFFYS